MPAKLCRWLVAALLTAAPGAVLAQNDARPDRSVAVDQLVADSSTAAEQPEAPKAPPQALQPEVSSNDRVAAPPAQLVDEAQSAKPPSQLSAEAQAVQAPADLSARSDSRNLRQPAVGGQDRCDQPEDKAPASCKDAVERRAEEFARQQREQDPEDRMLERQKADLAARSRTPVDPDQRSTQEVASVVYSQAQQQAPTSQAPGATAVSQDAAQQALIDAALKVIAPGK